MYMLHIFTIRGDDYKYVCMYAACAYQMNCTHKTEICGFCTSSRGNVRISRQSRNNSTMNTQTQSGQVYLFARSRQTAGFLCVYKVSQSAARTLLLIYMSKTIRAPACVQIYRYESWWVYDVDEWLGCKILSNTLNFKFCKELSGLFITRGL